MAVEIPEFRIQNSTAMDAFGKIAIISASDLDEDPDNIQHALEMIQSYRDAISTSSSSLSGLRDNVAEVPRMTKAFNRARKRTVAIMDDLLVQFRSAANQAADVEGLLNRMIESPNDRAQ